MFFRKHKLKKSRILAEINQIEEKKLALEESVKVLQKQIDLYQDKVVELNKLESHSMDLRGQIKLSEKEKGELDLEIFQLRKDLEDLKADRKEIFAEIEAEKQKHERHKNLVLDEIAEIKAKHNIKNIKSVLE
jgi:predicted  nucleic acid-binding Zn-ribbon protein